MLTWRIVPLWLGRRRSGRPPYVDVAFDTSCAIPRCDAWSASLVILRVERAATVTPCARTVCIDG